MSAWGTWPPSPPSAALTNAAVRAALYAKGSIPLWVPPTTPAALDDEFDSDTINPAWKFRNITTGPANQTPVFGALTENVDITGAASVPHVAINSQGRSSRLLMQTTVTGPAAYWVYKPMTWAAGKYYWCRMGAIARQNGRTFAGTSPNFYLWADAAGVPDVNNRAFIAYDFLNGTVRWTIVVGGVPTSVVNVLINEGQGVRPYFLIANPANVVGASANWYGEIFDDDGVRMIPSSIGNASFPWTPAYAGWGWIQTPNNALNAAPQALDVDFIRENTGHPLLHNVNR